MVWERRFGLGLGAIILIFVLYLVYRNEPFSDPGLMQLMRIVLSVGVAAVGSTIPGFLNIDMNLPGVAIRAGGGLAIFVLTYFYSPDAIKSLQPADPSINPISAVDFRTMAHPNKTEEERLGAKVVITVPVIFRNLEEPAKKFVVEETNIQLSLGGDEHEFAWRNFVNMHEENFGKWLGIEGSAVPFAVEAGGAEAREILHESDRLTWGNFLQKIRATKQKTISLKLNVKTNLSATTHECKADMTLRNLEIEQLIKNTGRMPGRVSTPCIIEEDAI